MTANVDDVGGVGLIRLYTNSKTSFEHTIANDAENNFTLFSGFIEKFQKAAKK
jgi:hypothetical protein